jgi:hypothetical protein
MAAIMFPDRDPAWDAIRLKWGKDWDAKRSLMLSDFSAIICRSAIVAVGAVVDVAYFRSLPDSEFKRAVKADPLSLAFHQVVMCGIKATEIIDKHSPIGIVVDDDRESSLSCYKRIHELKQTFPNVRERISDITFANDVAYPALQAADMLAYESRKLMIERKMNPEHSPSELWLSLTRMGITQPLLYRPAVLDMLSAGSYDGSTCDD